MTAQKKKLNLKSKRRLLAVIKYGVFGSCMAALTMAAAFRLQPLQHQFCPIEKPSVEQSSQEVKKSMPLSLKRSSEVAAHTFVATPAQHKLPAKKVAHVKAKHSKVVAKHQLKSGLKSGKKYAKHSAKSKKLLAKNGRGAKRVARASRPQVLDFTQ